MAAWFEGLPIGLMPDDVATWLRRYNPEVQPVPFARMAGIPWVDWMPTYGRPYAEIMPGRLWWPTGASRWGTYHGLADYSTIQQWREALYVDGEPEAENYGRLPGKLLISDKANTPVWATMYMLPPRPLSFYGLQNPLYLVTWVDERYFWWYHDTGTDHEQIDTWDGLFDFARAALGVEEARWLCEEVSESYFYPSEIIADSYNVPWPVVLDAAAWSVGRRVVIDFDPNDSSRGSVTIQTIDQAITARTSGMAGFPAAAGGLYAMAASPSADAMDAAAILPESVVVSFPVLDAFGDEEAREEIGVDTNTVTGFEAYTALDGTHVIYTDAEWEEGNAELDELAQIVAEENLRYEAEQITDVCLAGARAVGQSGLYDVTEIIDILEDEKQAVASPNGEAGDVKQRLAIHGRTLTRVTRPPFHFRPLWLHHTLDPVNGGSTGSAKSKSVSFMCPDGTTVTVDKDGNVTTDG